MLCGWCENAKAEVQCMDCKSPYCEDCRQTTHNRPAFRSHKVVPINESSRSKEHVCKEHDKSMDLFCVVCSNAVCSHCLLVGSHQGHKCTSVREMAMQAEEQLAQAVQIVEQRTVSLNKVKSEVDHIRPQVESEHEALQAQLYVQFSALQSAVERRRQELLEAARRLKDIKLMQLEQQSLRLEGLIEQASQGTKTSQRILTSCTEMEIVNFSATLQGRLKHISSQEIPKEACANSEFVSSFDLQLLDLVSSFGNVVGMESVLDNASSSPPDANQGSQLDAQDDNEDVFMSREAAEAVAEAARAAVARAEAAASIRAHPVMDGNTVVEDGEEGGFPEDNTQTY